MRVILDLFLDPVWYGRGSRGEWEAGGEGVRGSEGMGGEWKDGWSRGVYTMKRMKERKNERKKAFVGLFSQAGVRWFG